MQIHEIAAAAIGEADAARYIARSRSYLRQARMRGKGPAYVKVGRSISYMLCDLDAWLAQHRVLVRGGA